MKSRTYNSLRNISFSLAEQAATLVLMFVNRTIFIYMLGETYLGLNGLFSNILALLSLSDLGFGTAIMYSMYKPAADRNYYKVSALLTLYKNIYHIVGITMTVIGIMLVPFLDKVITDLPEIPELSSIYLLFLFNTTLTYFFAYKKSILVVEQDSHIISLIQIAASIIQNTGQILILLLSKNFLGYLIIQVFCTLINNICISRYVDRHYKYLRKCDRAVLDQETKDELRRNISGMFLGKLSSVIVTSTDNLLISKFVSTIILGYYSNYLLFINMLRTIITRIFEALIGSLGNFAATRSLEDTKVTFEKIWFANAWLVSFISIMLYILFNPFIELWIGKGYLLEKTTVFLICINFYMRFIRNTQLAFIDAFGLYWKIKGKAVAEAIINLSVSLFLLCYLDLGINGVLTGTFVSNILTNFWFEPYLIYKYKFQCNIWEYFIQFLKYSVLMLVTGAGIQYFCLLWFHKPLASSFIMQAFLCVAGINAVYCLAYRRNTFYLFYRDIVSGILKKIFKRRHQSGV